MQLTRKDEPPIPEPAKDYFSGKVFVRPRTAGEPSAGVRALIVRFSEPRARTFWHVHEGDQVLYVLEGQGLAQTWGEEAQDINPGDVVHIPAGEKHWHGAGLETSMVHLAVTAGKTQWMEEVTGLELGHKT